MLERLRGSVISLSILGFLLGAFSYSVIPIAGGTAPVQAQQSESVTNVTVRALSRTPAANTSFEVKFVTPVEIQVFSGSIVMELHEDIGVPPAIAPPMVRVSYSGDDDESGRGTASTIELDEQDDPRRPTTLTIYPVIAGEGRDAPPKPIPANATVTVTFDRRAGISNPTEGGAFSWKVGVGDDDNLVEAVHPEMAVREAFKDASTDEAASGLLVDREIQLSHEEISRGQTITVIARGFKNGHTLTVWRDANVNGMRESGESELCQVLVDGNDIGYCNFNVHSPPFTRGVGTCPDGMNSNDGELDCNFINAVDGLGGSTIILGKESNEIYEAAQLLELVGRIEADIVQGPGGDIQVQIFDFPPGLIAEVTIGGVPAEIDSLRVGFVRQAIFQRSRAGRCTAGPPVSAGLGGPG